jgi:predicted tellurium resistance membrane protein TerC
MKKDFHIPFWVHIVCFAITFFGWIGFSFFFDGARTKEGIANSIIEAFTFSVLMAIADCVVWGTRKASRESKGLPSSRP